MSVALNDDRVADIKPPGRIQTVQVEVEPDDDEVEEEREKLPSSEDGEGNEENVDPSASTQTAAPTPAADAQSSPVPVAHTQAQLVPTPSNEKAVAGLGRFSPPSLPAVAEGLQEAGRKAGKKSKKSKPLSTKDLLPLHKDVGRSNKQLLEPSTPEFRPTADWVCICMYTHSVAN